MGICFFTGTTACNAPIPSTGNCGQSLSRYYYNTNTGQCQFFTWGGCGTSTNNFLTLQACQTTCQNTGNAFST